MGLVDTGKGREEMAGTGEREGAEKHDLCSTLLLRAG